MGSLDVAHEADPGRRAPAISSTVRTAERDYTSACRGATLGEASRAGRRVKDSRPTRRASWLASAWSEETPRRDAPAATQQPDKGGNTSPSQIPIRRPTVEDMDTLTLNNDIEIPALGLGVFQTPPDETRAAVEAALSSGYRHIDTAAAYGNEREVGEAIHSAGLARDEVFIETKIWISDYGYDETLHGFDKSAGKLGVDGG